MSTHPLLTFERDLRARHQTRPPRLSDWKGSKWNKARRQGLHESALRHYYSRLGRGLSQQDRDQAELGPWFEWIRGSRASAAHVQSIAKFQASNRRRNLH